MGRKKVRFPSKTKKWMGKGVLMWWEAEMETVSKKRDRREGKEDVLSQIPLDTNRTRVYDTHIS